MPEPGLNYRLPDILCALGTLQRTSSSSSKSESDSPPPTESVSGVASSFRPPTRETGTAGRRTSSGSTGATRRSQPCATRGSKPRSAPTRSIASVPIATRAPSRARTPRTKRALALLQPVDRGGSGPRRDVQQAGSCNLQRLDGHWARADRLKSAARASSRLQWSSSPRKGFMERPRRASLSARGFRSFMVFRLFGTEEALRRGVPALHARCPRSDGCSGCRQVRRRGARRDEAGLRRTARRRSGASRSRCTCTRRRTSPRFAGSRARVTASSSGSWSRRVANRRGGSNPVLRPRMLINVIAAMGVRDAGIDWADRLIKGARTRHESLSLCACQVSEESLSNRRKVMERPCTLWTFVSRLWRSSWSCSTISSSRPRCR